MTSLAERNRTRITRGFESYDSAVTRSSQTKTKVEIGEKRPHNHIGNLGNYVWNSEGCLNKVYSI